jgi:hypothetical protein
MFNRLIRIITAGVLFGGLELFAGGWKAPAVLCDSPLFETPAFNEKVFMNPPDAVKPSIWWFWGESVTTSEGITKDLESLKRNGFGGVVVYEQLFTDRPGAFDSLSAEWLDCFRHAAAECARLGMVLEVNVSNGFVAGGPWITPELGMQRLIFSEMTIDGGKSVTVQVPLPKIRYNYYRDVAVLAWPARSGSEQAEPRPSVHSEPQGIDLGQLFDMEKGKHVAIRPGPDGACRIVLDYQEPFTARSLTYSMQPGSKALVIATQMPGNWSGDFLGQGMKPILPIGTLEASDDRANWQTICELPGLGFQHDGWRQHTVSFAAVTGRYFRLNLHDWNRLGVYKDQALMLGPVALSGQAKIDHWEAKSGNVVDFSNPDKTPAYSGDEVIDPDTIIDLTDKMDARGVLNWKAPAGRYTVMRFGHTPTGGRTKHGRPNNMGLECDKLNAAAVKVQFDNYVGVLLRETRKVPGARLAGVNIDSAEHGSQNWTGDFAREFKRRRRYDLQRYLPVMAGLVVGSPEVSDKFLYDVRRTIADLMSDRYFGAFQDLCRAEGMTSMAQAPGIATCLPSDNIQAKGRADIPMGEFWMSQPLGTIDCKETSSAAHVYGLPIAAAEAFTGSRPDAHPEMMKPFADAAMALGINRFVVLAFVHQPWDDRKPGVTQDRFYLPYQRHNTWWEMAGGFWDTLSRSCLMLRQGQPAADLLYHLGDDTPLKIATHRMRPVPPEGYDYDVCADEVLLSRVSVKDGRLVVPTRPASLNDPARQGASYRLLVLSGGDTITSAAATKILSLVSDGATVLASRPWKQSPSLTDGPDGNAAVRASARRLWGSDTPQAKGSSKLGKGTFYWGFEPAEVLKMMGIGPDVVFSRCQSASDILWNHRRTEDEDIYLVASHLDHKQEVEASFRITGRVPELWFPQTGQIAQPGGWRVENGRTVVPLRLESYDSVFVVFRKNSSVKVAAVERVLSETEVAGPWQVHFSPGWGTPETMEFERLRSWTEVEAEGVRYYSGSAVYIKEIELPATGLNERIELELAEVHVIASARLNGQDLGTCWKGPWRFDLTQAANAGKNRLEITAANTWVNRLIADSGLEEKDRLTWATVNPYTPEDRLPESGLIGPVKIRIIKVDNP